MKSNAESTRAMLNHLESKGFVTSWSVSSPNGSRVWQIGVKDGITMHLTTAEAYCWVSGVVTGMSWATSAPAEQPCGFSNGGL